MTAGGPAGWRASGRCIVIGDVHGCIQALRQLLRAVDHQPGDRLILLGDLIDRGPEPAAVVRLCRRLAEAGDVNLIAANHEEKYLRWRGHRRQRPHLLRHMRGVDAFSDLDARLDEGDIAWLESACLWTAVPDGIAVHAGIPARLKRLPPADVLPRGRHAGLMPLLNLRHQTPAGQPVPFGQETAGDPFWAETYDGRFGTVYFGHHAHIGAEEGVRYPHAVGLDLGCVYGGRLAAAVFEAPGIPPRLASVPCPPGDAGPGHAGRRD